MSIREYQEGSRVATKTAQLLTYAGTLPFIFTAAYPTALVNGAKIITISNTYAVAIISFICGIHWSLYMATHKQKELIFLVISNIVTLLALALLVFTSPMTACAGFLAIFASLLAIDSYAAKAEKMSKSFLRLRKNATLIVILSLLVLLLRQQASIT